MARYSKPLQVSEEDLRELEEYSQNNPDEKKRKRADRRRDTRKMASQDSRTFPVAKAKIRMVPISMIGCVPLLWARHHRANTGPFPCFPMSLVHQWA